MTPPRLSKIRDELAEQVFNNCGTGKIGNISEACFIDGFDRAVSILMPEIEKLVRSSLRSANTDPFSFDNMRFAQAELGKALASWKSFIEEQE